MTWIDDDVIRQLGEALVSRLVELLYKLLLHLLAQEVWPPNFASEENIAEIQSLRFHWRCAECGASDTRRGGRPDCCNVCGATNPEATEFLRPAGFSVDPRERAHAETDTPTYVPPDDPIASTRGTPWRSLPVPELGRFRCSFIG